MINEQARDEFGIDSTEVEGQFGTFSRAMNAVSIRTYIGAPAPRDVRVKVSPLPAARRRQTKQLLSWVFGVDGQAPVIAESRDLSELAIVLSDSKATKVLQTSRDLEEAYLVSPGQRDDLAKRLRRAETLLRTTGPEVLVAKDDPVVTDWVRRCAKAARALSQSIK